MKKKSSSLDRRKFLGQAVELGTGIGISSVFLGSALPAVADTSKKISSRRSGGVISLDGEWSIAIDQKNSGREQQWASQVPAGSRKVSVPSIIQQEFPAYHGVAWYWREFATPAHPDRGGRVLLRFEAVDYLAEVWVNGVAVGGHEGSETPFVLDITNALQATGQNRIALRVLNPGKEKIDGIALLETPHRNKFDPFYSGASYDSGGIIGSVSLHLVPAVRVEDVFVSPDWRTGAIRVRVQLQNAAEKALRGSLHLSVAPAATGITVCEDEQSVQASVGATEIQAELQVQDFRLWSLQDPYLYRVTARFQEEAGAVHEMSTRCGFRDFRVVRGYFRLNGKRVFVRSTHTGNHSPMGQILPPANAPDLLRQDLLYAKACGFNTVRFIGVAYP
jgi:beta-galactosidase/beta-glucuronidase